MLLSNHLLFVVVRGRRLSCALLLLDMDDAQIQHRNLNFVWAFYELLLVGKIQVVAVFVKFIVLLFKLRCLLTELRGLFKKLKECSFSVIGLRELYFELFRQLLVHLVVVIKLVKVIYELLVILYG